MQRRHRLGWGAALLIFVMGMDVMWVRQGLDDEAEPGDSDQTTNSFETLQLCQTKVIGPQSTLILKDYNRGVCFVLFHHKWPLFNPTITSQSTFSSVSDPLPTHPPEGGP